MTQAACVLLSQLLFLAGADARDNKVKVYYCSELLNKPRQSHKANKLNAPLELKLESTQCPDSGGAAGVSSLDRQVVSLDRTFSRFFVSIHPGVPANILPGVTNPTIDSHLIKGLEILSVTSHFLSLRIATY